MRLALDTNILAYAEGVNGSAMKERAVELLQRLPPEAAAVPVQALGELYQVLVRKAGLPPSKAREIILGWRDAFPLIDTSASVMLSATELAAAHQIHLWDAVVLAAAAAGGCRLLLSEDLQDGFTWNAVTVANPFAPQPHGLLEALLSSR